MSGAQVRSLTLGEGETAVTQRESGSKVCRTAVFALLIYCPQFHFRGLFTRG